VITAQQSEPLFDHSNGTKSAVTVNQTIITTGGSHVFLWIATDAAIVVRTDGSAAVDDGTGAYLGAGFNGIIPVSPSVAVTALSITGTANVRVVPFMVRP